MTGTATVNAKGIVSDGYNFVFDSPGSLVQTVPITDSQSGTVTVNLDLSTAPANNGPLGAGNAGNASMTITNGQTVQSTGGYFGFRAGSNGTATVSGAGTYWNLTSSSYPLAIGSNGTGSLSVTGGATVGVPATAPAPSPSGLAQRA